MYGALGALEAMVEERKKQKEFLVGEELNIGDIAAVCALGHINFIQIRPDRKEQYPTLKAWWEILDEGDGFRDTRPLMFDLTESVV